MTVGRDFGNEIEVVPGIKASDWVIVNPSDSLVSGEQVRLGTAGGDRQRDNAAAPQ